MTTDNAVEKSMISGGNTEGLKTETPPPAPSAADVIFADPAKAEPDAKAEGDAAAGAEGEKTPEQKAEDQATADKAEADRIAAMTPEEKKAHDDKVEADKKAADDKAAEEAAAKEPIDLTDMVLPEGWEPEADIMADLTQVVNDRKLDKETAEALAPIGAKIAENTVKKINDGYADIRAGWRDEVANDPVLGTKEQMAIADAGLGAYGTPALRKLLDETGLGDHPEVIRAFHKIGKRVAQDVFERGGSGDTRRANAADAMYPTMKT